MKRRAPCLLAAALAIAVPTLAAAQVRPEREVETTRGPAAELYIRKRPPAPEAPVLSAELKTLLASTEKRRDDKRLEAIGLLRNFLDSKPTGESRAEGTFKLAELNVPSARDSPVGLLSRKLRRRPIASRRLSSRLFSVDAK